MTHVAHFVFALVAVVLASPLGVHAQMPPRAGHDRAPAMMVQPGGLAETHHRLAEIHRAHAMDHLRALHDYADGHAVTHTPVDRALVLEHVTAIEQHLDAAQRHEEAEERDLTDRQRQANRARFEAVRADHADAVRHQAELAMEADRPVYDLAAMAAHSAAAYHAMRRAHDQHVALGRSLGVHDAVMPPQPVPPPAPAFAPRAHHRH